MRQICIQDRVEQILTYGIEQTDKGDIINIKGGKSLNDFIRKHHGKRFVFERNLDESRPRPLLLTELK